MTGHSGLLRAEEWKGHLQVEADRQLEVKLDGGALELAPQGVKHCDVNLRAVEGAIGLVQLHSAQRNDMKQ